MKGEPEAGDLQFLRNLSAEPAWTSFLDAWSREADPIRRIDQANAFASEHGRRLPRVAGELLARTLVLAREADYRLGQAHVLANLGWNRLDGDEYQSARSLLLEGLELAREAGDTATVLRCLNGLGACYSDMGLYERAVIQYREALEQADQARLVDHHGLILTNLARCHIDLGQFEAARECLEQVVETSDSLPLNRAIRLHRLAIVYRHLDRLDEAAALVGQALALAGPYPTLVTQCTVEAAWVAHRQGNEAAAEALLQPCRNDPAVDPRGRTEVLLALAAVREATGRAGEAEVLLQEALGLADSLGAGILRIQACQRLSEHFNRRQEYRRALEYSERCRLLEQELARATSAQLIAGFEEEKTRREAQLYREQYRQMLAIGEIGRLITSSLELDRIIDTVHTNLHRLMAVDSLLIGIYDPASLTLLFRSNITDGRPLPEYRLALDEPNLATRCFRTRSPILINNLAAEYERYPTEELARSWSFPMAGLMFVPLQHGERTIGVLGVQCRHAGVYTAHHLNTIGALASYVAIALENASLYEQLNVLASEDALTGCFNRRRFAEMAAEEIRRAERYYENLSFIMIDLDHFKMINDSHGHAGGDVVLKSAARLIQALLRDSDAVCRWGGEEFALLVPHTDLAGGRLLAERIRQQMREHPILLADGAELRISASFGVAQWRAGGDDFESVIRRADRALYQAKRDGRDRVCLDCGAGTVPEDGEDSCAEDCGGA